LGTALSGFGVKGLLIMEKLRTEKTARDVFPAIEKKERAPFS
jgi:hypothetical protein